MAESPSAESWFESSNQYLYGCDRSAFPPYLNYRREEREDLLDVAKITAHLKALRFQASLLREPLKNPFQPRKLRGLPTVGPVLTRNSVSLKQIVIPGDLQ